MKRLANWMMRLYPSRWRARYGDELNALITDTGADARVVGDLFKGGVRMQLKTWSFLKHAVALGLLGMVLGAGVALLLPREYTSRATVQVTPATINESALSDSPVNHLNEWIQLIETNIMSRGSLSGIINDPRLQLYSGERSNQPLEDVVEEMRNAIHIDFVALPGQLGRRASAFNIEFTCPDRFKAQLTVTALVNKFMELNMTARQTLPSDSSSLIVVDVPSFPASPLFPGRWVVMFAGFLAGVVIASIWRTASRAGLIVKRFERVAVAFGLMGVAAVIVASNLDIVPYRYRSQATLELPKGAGADRIQALQTDVLSRSLLSGIITNQRFSLYGNELRTMPLEDVVQTMKQHLIVKPFRFHDTWFFNVAFDYPDRFKAQQTVSKIVDAFIDADLRRYPVSPAPPPAPPGIVMDVLDTPSLPVNPTSPRPLQIALLGGGFGIVIAAIVTLIRRRWNPEAGFPAGALPE